MTTKTNNSYVDFIQPSGRALNNLDDARAALLHYGSQAETLMRDIMTDAKELARRIDWCKVRRSQLKAEHSKIGTSIPASVVAKNKEHEYMEETAEHRSNMLTEFQYMAVLSERMKVSQFVISEAPSKEHDSGTKYTYLGYEHPFLDETSVYFEQTVSPIATTRERLRQQEREEKGLEEGAPNEA